jgi:GT2 family glycosyltransferase
MKEPLITIIIPTWDNPDYLRPAVVSLLRNQATKGLFEILVINNGHPKSCDYLKGQKQVRVINAGRNLGWEGGIDLGMKNSTSPFVCFFNDDAHIPTSSRLWLNQLIQHMRDEKVAAVGPASNVVMGWQNIFADTPLHVFESKFLIGFCVLMRRSAFEAIGGMDLALPGGDDFDWSIRLRDAEYKLLVDKTVFVYHHGFKTGERVYGNPNSPQGWNSFEKTEKTNLALIKKHGLKKWWDLMKGAFEEPKVEFRKAWEDIEGHVIKNLVRQDKTVLDIGCGDKKTVKKAIGVDFVKKGERIVSLEGEPVSDADVEADVSRELPFEDNYADAIIARHILEHMIDPVSALIFWIKKLKPGGRLILALPNEDWHLTIPMNLEHVHAYTPQSTAVLLAALGLKDLQIIPSGNNISFVAVGTK